MAQSRSGKMRMSKDNGTRKKSRRAGLSKNGLKTPAGGPVFPGGIRTPSAHIGMWRLDPRGGRLTWSQNCAPILQKELTDLPRTLQELESLVADTDRGTFQKELDTAQKHKKTFRFEIRIHTTRNEECWIEFAGESPGILGEINGTIQDITTHKLTQAELTNWKTRDRLVSESAGLIIYDYDLPSGEIIWSGNTKQLVGFTSEEIGRIEKWEELIHADDRESATQLLEFSRDNLTPYEVYYRFRKKSGVYVYMHDRGQFVTDSNGQAFRMLGILNDVSDRLKADLALKESEKSYRELFDSVGEAICIQRRDGTFVDVNRTTCNIYGYSKEELVGKSPGFIAAPGKNDFEEVRRKIEEALIGKPQSFLWWGRKKSGENLIMEVKLTRGSYFGEATIIATSRDITDKIAAEYSLQESEKRFRRLVQDLNIAVILQGAAGDIQVVNTAALSLLGVREKALVSHTLNGDQWLFLNGDMRPISKEKLPWNIAATTHRAVRGMVVGIRKSEEEDMVWTLVNAEPVLQVDDNLLHVVIALTDITERKKVEEDLKESELRFRTLQEASFGGIGLHNMGKIIDCNQGLCNLTGYSYDELKGSNGLNLIAPEHRDFVYKQIVNKVELPYDVEGIRKDGSRYYLEIQGKNIPYEKGLIRVTEFRDITDRKAVESDMLEQNARLVAITEDLKVKNEQLQEFTQIVSHNLRSPVGNILALLNFIETAGTPKERGEYLQLLREAGTSILTTLHELNEVLQIQQNKSIEKQVLHFDQVFSNVRKMLVAKIVEINAEIITDFSAAPIIEYPNIYLESIMLNLLSNALKYHSPLRKPRIILKSLPLETGGISLSVSDNGQGINMQRYGHQIFKLRKTFHRHPESRGIGLFMIRNQIDAMGGDISVVSAENEGTTFLVNFTGKTRENEYKGTDSGIG